MIGRVQQSDQYRVLVRRLVEARIGLNVSQADLAQKLGKPQSFVSKYERGERRLDVVEYLTIAKILNCNLGEILSMIDREIKVEKV